MRVLATPTGLNLDNPVRSAGKTVLGYNPEMVEHAEIFLFVLRSTLSGLQFWKECLPRAAHGVIQIRHFQRPKHFHLQLLPSFQFIITFKLRFTEHK